MKKMKIKKIFWGFISAVMICTAVPVTGSSADDDIIYFADFEDGKNDFTGRDGLGTASIVDSGADGSAKCMEFSGREESWQGPQILLDDMCEPGVEYLASVSIKTPWYASVSLSTEYTDSGNERHYNPINSAVSNNGWVQLSDVKFSIPENTTKNYIYFECSDTNVNISIDNFMIKKAPVKEIQKDIVSLKKVFANNFKVGTAVTASELSPKSTKDLILKHFNSITPGNELKPDAILDKNASLAMAANGDDTNPQVNISSARSILDFCRDNNIPVRGHVLVWHSQTPDWFFKENYDENADWVSKEKMLKRMENYIKNVFATVLDEYPTVDFYAWDVVNEAWLDDGSYRQPGSNYEKNGNSAWVQVFGDNSFIEPAFEYARKYAPKGCKLYYNDYNEYMDGKRDAIYNMAMDLKEKGLIDGIGMQSHLDVSFPGVSAYKKALDKFVSTGLDVQITELDVTTSDKSEEGFKKQAEYYKEIVDACVEKSDSISALVFWGTTDDKSWRADRSPLLFNEDYTAKEAFYSIVEGKQESEIPTDPKPTDPTQGEDDFLSGDVNMSGGEPDVEDLVLMQKYLLGEETFTEMQFDIGNMNSDDTVNIYDSIILKRTIISVVEG